MTLERRIFVIGVPRSGTTLVQSLLAAHTDVASSTESHFFDRHFRPVPGWPSRALCVRDPEPAVRSFLEANGVDLEEDAPSFRFFQEEQSPLSPRLRPWLAHAVARRLLHVLDDLAQAQDRGTWVEKTPAHLRYLPFLERVAGRPEDPELRFVHVVRRGLDTVASLHRASRHWTRPYGVDECVRRWNREVALTRRRVRSPRDHVIFYEDLTSRPEAESRRLLQALGLPWQREILERYGAASDRITTADEAAWKADVGRGIAPSSTALEVFSPEERRRAEKTLRSVLYDELRQECRGSRGRQGGEGSRT